MKCWNITKFCYRKLQNSQDPCCCKECIKQILPFSAFAENQLIRLTKGNLIFSTKKMIQENNLTSLNDELTFLNDEYGTSVNSDCFTHDEVYKALDTISPTYNLYLHINISPLPCHWSEIFTRKM